MKRRDLTNTLTIASAQFNYFPNIFAPNNKVITNKTRKIKKSTLAMEAAPAAIPPKPKIAAIIAITKKITAHFSMMIKFSYYNLFKILCQKYRLRELLEISI